MINSQLLEPSWEIAINGKPLTETQRLSVKSISFEEKLTYTAKVELTISGGELFDLKVADVATESELSLAMGWGGEAVTLFAGDITEVTPEFEFDRASAVTVVAYDRSYQLKKFRFPPEMYDKTKMVDVVRAVMDKYRKFDLDYIVDSDAPIKDFVLSDYQAGFRPDDQTDWQFLGAIAEANDLMLFVRDHTIYFVGYGYFDKPQFGLAVPYVPNRFNLYFRPLANEESDGRGILLYKFKPRNRALKQRDKVELIAWTSVDAQGRRRGGAELEVERGRMNYTQVKVASNRIETISISGTAQNTNDAIMLAQAEIDKRARKFVEGQGSMKGWPLLRMGQKHNFVVRDLGDFGEKFSGEYFISGTEHTWTRESGYRTSIDVERKALSE